MVNKMLLVVLFEEFDLVLSMLAAQSLFSYTWVLHFFTIIKY